MSLASTLEIIEELKAGRMVVLVDEEDRENEGDLVLAGEHVTPEAINFMAKYGRGLICLTLTEARCRQLGLQLMVRDNRSPHGTAFTTSIEAAEGVTTGISAHDRARTVQAAVARHAKPSDIVQPGHIFPLMAQNGGVLIRAGHTEAGCDLAALAGYIARKGSITVNGVSLTVNRVEGTEFSINLIPHTVAVTNLKQLEAGSRVNLEIDLIARYVERMLAWREESAQ